MSRPTERRYGTPAIGFTVALLISANVGAFGFTDIERVQHKAIVAQRKFEEARLAQADRRRQLLSEHQHLIRELMQEMHDMHDMKPARDMSMAENESWITAHLQLMDDLLRQMMADHEMMVATHGCK